MSSKRKPAKKRDPNQITVAAKPNEDEAVALARTFLRPTVQAAVTLKEYGKAYGDLDLSGLIDALTVQTKAASDGDLKRGDAMLATQAHILDAIFNNLRPGTGTVASERAVHNSEYAAVDFLLYGQQVHQRLVNHRVGPVPFPVEQASKGVLHRPGHCSENMSFHRGEVDDVSPGKGLGNLNSFGEYVV